jgi:hypothetical protein
LKETGLQQGIQCHPLARAASPCYKYGGWSFISWFKML